MVILIATAVIIIVLLAAIMVLYHRYTRASGDLFAARQDAARYRAKLDTAKRAAQQAERQLSASLASTSKALNVARQIEVVRRQMADLFEFIGFEGRHESADAGQPAVTADYPFPLEPGSTPYGPREIPAEPVTVPHDHIDHTRALPYVTDSRVRPARAAHPGQRRSA